MRVVIPWGEVSHIHHGQKVRVFARSTPDFPEIGEGPFPGTIECPKEDVVPILIMQTPVRGYRVGMFADWWEVLFDDPMSMHYDKPN